MDLESYQGTESTGEIRVRHEPKSDLSGKHVLLLDDILDTGLTLEFSRAYAKIKNAETVRSAVLLKKDRPRVSERLADCIGFTVPDKFVIGYGLDYNGQYRHLPDICVLEK